MEGPEIPWVSMLKWSKLNWMIWVSPISGNRQMVVDSITIETCGMTLVNAFLNLWERQTGSNQIWLNPWFPVEWSLGILWLVINHAIWGTICSKFHTCFCQLERCHEHIVNLNELHGLSLPIQTVELQIVPLQTCNWGPFHSHMSPRVKKDWVQLAAPNYFHSLFQIGYVAEQMEN